MAYRDAEPVTAFGDVAAAEWLNAIEIRLYPATEGRVDEARLAARREVIGLRDRLEQAGLPPSLIVPRVRALLVEHGLDSLSFVERADERLAERMTG